MANFSQDQVRQFYVVKRLVNTLTSPGDLKVNTSDEYAWFEYMSPNGNNGNPIIVRSDLIDKKKIVYMKTSEAKTRKLKKVKVTLNSEINSGAPLAGQDYILRFVFYGLGIGGVENQYIKEGGAYRVKTGDTAAKVYATMKKLAEINFSREAYPMVNFSLDGDKAQIVLTANSGITVKAKEAGTEGNSISFHIDDVAAATAGISVVKSSGVTTITASLTSTADTIGDLKALVASNVEANALIEVVGTNATSVVAESSAQSLTGGTTTGLLVEEVLQPWVLGKRQASPLDFEVFAVPVNSDGVPTPWAEVEDVTASNSNVQTNGKMVADMEWFYIGERADQFRGVGYPDNFETTYTADPSKEYDFLDIEFYYAGDAEDVQKSKKVLTIAADNSVVTYSDLETDIIDVIEA